jgi:SNF2 family DNA or RNA helicase
MVIAHEFALPRSLKPHQQKDGTCNFPICGDIARRLLIWCETVEDPLEIDPDLMDILSREKARQLSLSRLAGLEDTCGRAELYPYQRVGVSWLQAARRAILADAQGLGKTVQALVAADDVTHDRAVIVCNMSKIQEWLEHAMRWTGWRSTALTGPRSQREEQVQRWRGGQYECIICNFQTAAEFAGALSVTNTLIVDEAHNIRNRQTQTFEGLRSLARAAQFVFLLSASPTVNSTVDIWSLLTLVDPARFGSFWSFAYRFCQVDEKLFGVEVGGVRDEERENLSRLLTPYVLARDRAVVQGLPRQEQRVVRYTMPEEHRRAYERWASEEPEPDMALAWITKLRQLAIHPRLVDPHYDLGGASKFDEVRKVLGQRKGKTIVFTQFAEAAGMLQDRLLVWGIEAARLTGGMSPTVREENLEYFKHGEARVLVATLKTGGEGLNLVEADGVIFLDLAWHPAGNQHAQYRVDRIGQKADRVEIYAILTEGTIEEHVWEIVGNKREVLIEEIMDRLGKERHGTTTSHS